MQQYEFCRRHSSGISKEDQMKTPLIVVESVGINKFFNTCLVEYEFDDLACAKHFAAWQAEIWGFAMIWIDGKCQLISRGQVVG
jgi:hypothetical protein